MKQAVQHLTSRSLHGWLTSFTLPKQAQQALESPYVAGLIQHIQEAQYKRHPLPKRRLPLYAILGTALGVAFSIPQEQPETQHDLCYLSALGCQNIDAWYTRTNKALACANFFQRHYNPEKADEKGNIYNTAAGKGLLVELQWCLNNRPGQRCYCTSTYCEQEKAIRALADYDSKIETSMDNLRYLMGLNHDASFRQKAFRFGQGATLAGGVAGITLIARSMPVVNALVWSTTFGLAAAQINHFLKMVDPILENEALLADLYCQAVYPDQYDKTMAQKWGTHTATACLARHVFYNPVSPGLLSALDSNTIVLTGTLLAAKRERAIRKAVAADIAANHPQAALKAIQQQLDNHNALRYLSVKCDQIHPWRERADNALAYAKQFQYHYESKRAHEKYNAYNDDVGKGILVELQWCLNNYPCLRNCNCVQYDIEAVRVFCHRSYGLPDYSTKIRNAMTRLRNLMGLAHPIDTDTAVEEGLKSAAKTGLGVAAWVGLTMLCPWLTLPVLAVSSGSLISNTVQTIDTWSREERNPKIKNERLLAELYVQAVHPDQYGKAQAQKWGARFVQALVVVDACTGCFTSPPELHEVFQNLQKQEAATAGAASVSNTVAQKASLVESEAAAGVAKGVKKIFFGASVIPVISSTKKP